MHTMYQLLNFKSYNEQFVFQTVDRYTTQMFGKQTDYGFGKCSSTKANMLEGNNVYEESVDRHFFGINTRMAQNSVVAKPLLIVFSLLSLSAYV